MVVRAPVVTTACANEILVTRLQLFDAPDVFVIEVYRNVNALAFLVTVNTNQNTTGALKRAVGSLGRNRGPRSVVITIGRVVHGIDARILSIGYRLLVQAVGTINWTRAVGRCIAQKYSVNLSVSKW